MIKVNFREKILVFAVLAVITGLLYANSLKNGFFFDDYTELIENSFVQHPTNFFKRSLEASQEFTQDIAHFRPIPLVYRIVLYHVFQKNAFYYHLTNAILLLFLCYLVFELILLLTRDKFVSLLSAILFCVHPQNTTPINFIISHDSLIYTIFCIYMAIFFIHYLQEKTNKRYYCISIVFYILAILSHDAAIHSFTVLFLIALLGYQQNLKSSFKLCVPYLYCAFVYWSIKFLAASRTVTEMGGSVFSIHLDIPHVLFSALRLIGAYLVEFLVPVKFVFMWALRADPYNVALKGLGVLLLIMLGLFLVFKDKKRPMRALALSWFFIGFLPVPFSMFVYYGSLMGVIIEPTWFFFNSIGFFLLLALLLKVKEHDFGINVLKIVLSISLILFWGGWTIRYNDIWTTPKSYAQYWLKVVPNNTYALLSLGKDCLRTNEPRQAIFYFNQLLQKGDEYSLNDNMGEAYWMMGKFDQSYAYFKKALTLNPKDEFASDKIGMYFYNRNDFDQAKRFFETAHRASPDALEPLMDLGFLDLRLGKFPDAIDDFKNSLRLVSPDDKQYQAILAKLLFCYYETGMHQEFDTTLNLYFSENSSQEAAVYLTNSALDFNDLRLALYFSNGGIKLFSNSPDIYAAEGKAFVNHGLSLQAQEIYEQGLKQFPANRQIQELVKG